jgi:ATP-dependent DNA ligase
LLRKNRRRRCAGLLSLRASIDGVLFVRFSLQRGAQSATASGLPPIPTPATLLSMSVFISPMLTSRLTDAAMLADPRYVAEPKLDGQRAQVHVERGRTVAV